MTLDEFWEIVERVHEAAPLDMAAKCRLLRNELCKLPVEEVLSFEEHFTECYYRAYAWDIWGAAYVINGGCSDDGFMDFRSTLISLGRRPFETALADADRLAEFELDEEWACYEGYQSVALEVCRNHHKSEPPANWRRSEHPREPAGEPFDEEEMGPRFPRLVAKYQYEDTAPEALKQKRARRARVEEMSEKVKTILLAGIIPRSGRVPPLRIVKQVLASGRAPASSELRHEWEPFELEEEAFWLALRRLEAASSEDLKDRSDLKGRQIALDAGYSGTSDYGQWASSLAERGLQ
jgi:hypothetical protein